MKRPRPLPLALLLPGTGLRAASARPCVAGCPGISAAPFTGAQRAHHPGATRHRAVQRGAT